MWGDKLETSIWGHNGGNLISWFCVGLPSLCDWSSNAIIRYSESLNWISLSFYLFLLIFEVSSFESLTSRSTTAGRILSWKKWNNVLGVLLHKTVMVRQFLKGRSFSCCLGLELDGGLTWFDRITITGNVFANKEIPGSESFGLGTPSLQCKVPQQTTVNKREVGEGRRSA